MAQVPCIGLYKPYTNLPFGVCAMYFYPQVDSTMFFNEVWFISDLQLELRLKFDQVSFLNVASGFKGS